ncbi:MAG: XdhC/CoxI family protein [Candidatus Omnitrophota bacterium]|jgi:xanthine dehydrogenase accessory factor
MDPLILAAYNASLKNQSFAFATIIKSSDRGTPRKTGAKMILTSDGDIMGTVGGGIDEKRIIQECQKAIKRNQHKIIHYELTGQGTRPICGGKYSIFIEPFAQQRHLIICGAGHIALPLSVIAKILNFKVTIIDNRKHYANKNRFPHVNQIITGTHAAKLRKLKTTGNTYIVIVTHGHEHDFKCLNAALDMDTKAGYIGVISSQIKRISFMKKLKTLGYTQTQLKRISMPVGIDIGAHTPEEIAVSIIAEIISTYNKDSLKAKKFNTKKT